MQTLGAEPVATGLYGFLDESLRAVPEGLEVREDVDVDEVRRAELAHRQVHLLPLAARLPRRQRFAVELRLGVKVLVDPQRLGHCRAQIRRVRANDDRR